MLRMAFVVATLLASGVFFDGALADDAAGAVSQKKGTSTATLEGSRKPLDLGTSVFMNEELATGAAARLEVTFVDATKLTLGERAKVRIDEFVFDARKTQVLKLAAVGALRFVSGGNRSNARVTLRTPVAVIGIRGTDFWFGPIDGQFGVLLLDGAVSVSNGAGAVVLDQQGEGTNIAGPGSAPGPVTQWPQDKVGRALAAVAF